MGWRFRRFKLVAGRNNVQARIKRHMGHNCLETHIISHDVQPLEQVNLQLVLDKWTEQAGQSSEVFGYTLAQYAFEKSLAHFLSIPESVAPVEREHAAVNTNETLACVTRGIYLLKFQEQPIVIMIQKGDSVMRKPPKLELMGATANSPRMPFTNS